MNAPQTPERDGALVLTNEQLREGGRLCAELRAADDEWEFSEKAITRLERAQSAFDAWVKAHGPALFAAARKGISDGTK